MSASPTIELLPGALIARLFDHTVTHEGASLRCTTWRTRGFAAIGHPELTLTLVREPGDGVEVVSLDTVRFVTGLFTRAQKGEAPLASSMTAVFPSGGLMEPAQLLGAAFVAPVPIADVPLPPTGLHALVMHPDELSLARAFGVQRVLARLARQARRAPPPFWWDPSRAPISDPSDDESALAPIARMAVSQGFATLRARTVDLCFAPRLVDVLARALDAHGDAPFALLTDAAPDADALLVWTPGQSAVSAVPMPDSQGAAVSGNFVRFTPGAARDRLELLEDGFDLQLTDTSWTRWREALTTGTPCSLDTPPDARTATLRWHEDPPPPPAARLQRIGVMRGLTPPKQGLDAPTLAAYTRPLRAALEAHFAETWSPSPQDLVVHVELHAGRAPMIDFALNPGPAHAALNGLHRALMAVSAPEVTAPVVLRIYYALWGGVTVDGPPPAER